MRVEHDDGVRACAAAVRAFRAAVETLDDHALLAPSRCAGWSRLDAVVHTHHGLQEMLLGVVSPTTEPPDVDAATYWGIDLLNNDDEAITLDGLGFLHRSSSAYRRPTGAVRHLRVTADTLAGALERMPEANVAFQGHVLTSGDFLATWAVELAVHHLDLDLPADAPGPDPDALALARRTAEALAGHRIEAATDTDAVLRGWGRLT